jgi:hypothetical protein
VIHRKQQVVEHSAVHAEQRERTLSSASARSSSAGTGAAGADGTAADGEEMLGGLGALVMISNWACGGVRGGGEEQTMAVVPCLGRAGIASGATVGPGKASRSVSLCLRSQSARCSAHMSPFAGQASSSLISSFLISHVAVAYGQV